MSMPLISKIKLLSQPISEQHITVNYYIELWNRGCQDINFLNALSPCHFPVNKHYLCMIKYPPCQRQIKTVQIIVIDFRGSGCNKRLIIYNLTELGFRRLYWHKTQNVCRRTQRIRIKYNWYSLLISQRITKA